MARGGIWKVLEGCVCVCVCVCVEGLGHILKVELWYFKIDALWTTQSNYVYERKARWWKMKTDTPTPLVCVYLLSNFRFPNITPCLWFVPTCLPLAVRFAWAGIIVTKTALRYSYTELRRVTEVHVCILMHQNLLHHTSFPHSLSPSLPPFPPPLLPTPCPFIRML